MRRGEAIPHFHGKAVHGKGTRQKGSDMLDKVHQTGKGSDMMLINTAGE